jgi:hypothetical protein
LPANGTDDLPPAVFVLHRLVQLGPDDESVGVLAEPGNQRDPALVGVEETLPLGSVRESNRPAPGERAAPVGEVRLDHDLESETVGFIDRPGQPGRVFVQSTHAAPAHRAVATDPSVRVDADPVDPELAQLAHGVDHQIGSPDLPCARTRDGHAPHDGMIVSSCVR